MTLPTFESLAADHAAWSNATFGSPSERGPLGPLKHLLKEVDECLAAPRDPKEYADLLLLVLDASRRAHLAPTELLFVAMRRAAVSEYGDSLGSIPGLLRELKGTVARCMRRIGEHKFYGDLLALTFAAAEAAGISATELLCHAEAKLAENKTRTWPTVSGDEPVEHDRSAEAA